MPFNGIYMMLYRLQGVPGPINIYDDPLLFALYARTRGAYID